MIKYDTAVASTFWEGVHGIRFHKKGESSQQVGTSSGDGTRGAPYGLSFPVGFASFISSIESGSLKWLRGVIYSLYGR